ncbi:transcriptional regulator [Catellatospora bangladeshensis]|uniref:transcriptional regulator n=1 Tax=Catellatospora bangladeshensis TaxID=310355 RepID=UPI00361D70F1
MSREPWDEPGGRHAPSAAGQTDHRDPPEPGYSQTRLAALLCAAAGADTVTRHEVSRWERGERLPGGQWLAWLELVLDLPPALLAATARPARGPAPPDAVDQLCRLAERWLRETADRSPPPGRRPRPAPGPAMPGTGPRGTVRRRRRPACSRAGRPTAARGAAADGRPGGRGGSGAGGTSAVAAGRVPPAPGAGADRRRLLRPAAELAQLAGWTAGDAGDQAAALRAYRSGLLLAAEAGDAALGGHLLGGASHLLAEARPRVAWQLARIGAAGARRGGTPGLRALLAHRAALAAARCADGSAAGQSLLVAQRLGEQLTPAAEPSWLYWLDQAELAAMTGRCLVLLDRPLRALPLLDGAAARRRGQPRTAAVYAGWRARALLGIGEVEQACAAGGDAAIEAVRSGSVRAAEQTRELSARLARRRHIPAVHDLSELIRQLMSYLPGSSTPGGVN